MKQKKASGIILSIIICILMFIFTIKSQIVIAEVVTLQGTKEPINTAIYVTKNELNQEFDKFRLMCIYNLTTYTLDDILYL